MAGYIGGAGNKFTTNAAGFRLDAAGKVKLDSLGKAYMRILAGKVYKSGLLASGKTIVGNRIVSATAAQVAAAKAAVATAKRNAARFSHGLGKVIIAQNKLDLLLSPNVIPAKGTAAQIAAAKVNVNKANASVAKFNHGGGKVTTEKAALAQLVKPQSLAQLAKMKEVVALDNAVAAYQTIPNSKTGHTLRYVAIGLRNKIFHADRKIKSFNMPDPLTAAHRQAANVAQKAAAPVIQQAIKAGHAPKVVGNDWVSGLALTIIATVATAGLASGLGLLGPAGSSVAAGASGAGQAADAALLASTLDAGATMAEAQLIMAGQATANAIGTGAMTSAAGSALMDKVVSGALSPQAAISSLPAGFNIVPKGMRVIDQIKAPSKAIVKSAAKKAVNVAMKTKPGISSVINKEVGRIVRQVGTLADPATLLKAAGGLAGSAALAGISKIGGEKQKTTAPKAQVATASGPVLQGQDGSMSAATKKPIDGIAVAAVALTALTIFS